MNSLKSLLLLPVLALLSVSLFASIDTTFVETKVNLQTTSGTIYGTLTTPLTGNQWPVALIIAGSGPTDRDGNNVKMKNNSLKILAGELEKRGIASLRYDKRGIAESKDAGKSEADLRFDDYIADAAGWLALLKKDKRFTQVIVIGHSEGSLIGMIAAGKADKFVSVAGAGRSADKVLKQQLGAQPKEIQEVSFPIIDSLKAGKTVADAPAMLYSLFRPIVQPYMISWFKYDPALEIKKLTIPTLIVQGTNDIQVSVEDAKLLAAANPKAGIMLIENMNHVFRIVTGDRQANMAAYGNPEVPISDELVKGISDFILKK